MVSTIDSQYNAGKTAFSAGDSAILKAIAGAPPEHQGMLKAQHEMKQAENLLQFISNFLNSINKRNEIIAGNMR